MNECCKKAVADALEEAVNICNDMSIKYGIAMSKANQRSSDGIYDQRKGGREASLLCGEKILALIKRNAEGVQ